jgi:hypothetical protein
MNKKNIYTEKSVENLSDYKKALKNMNKEIQKLEKSRDMMAELINDIEHITGFHRNVALHVETPHPDDCTHSFGIHAVPDNNRSAEIYHNAHKPDSEDNWGVRIYDFNQPDTFDREKWLGTGHKKEDATRIAKDWIALGLVPP